MGAESKEMTVGDLIAWLNEFNHNTRVVIPHGNDGVQDIKTPILYIIESGNYDDVTHRAIGVSVRGDMGPIGAKNETALLLRGYRGTLPL